MISSNTNKMMTMARLIMSCGLIVAGSGWGCLSMQSQTSIDSVSTANGTARPYVEAYVEYAGPQSKWAGPATYILHVAAKDAGVAQITTTPALLSAEADPEAAPSSPTVSRRTPAASALSQAGGEHVNAAAAAASATSGAHVTSVAAREQLARLAIALQGAQTPFHGCMSPVRVRLIRADGGIFERQGCRGELGWSRTVSDAVSFFVDAGQHGTRTPTIAKPAVQTRNDVDSARSSQAHARRSVAAASGATAVDKH